MFRKPVGMRQRIATGHPPSSNAAGEILLCGRAAWVIPNGAHLPLDSLHSWEGTLVGLTAAVERAHSDRARSGSTGPTGVPSILTFCEQGD